MRVPDLFDPEPEAWGLRGDPHLWRALCVRLAGQVVPASAGDLASLLHAAFRDLTGIDLASDLPRRRAGSSTLTAACPAE